MAVESLETLLTQWRSIEPEMIEIDSINTDNAYQPRIARLPPYRDQGRVEEAAQQHINTLTGKLGDDRDLDPVLVARINGQLFLIDGHHRLNAYRKAKRTTVPACIRDSTKKQATRASLVVNCDFVKLPMHKEQCRDAAWQYIAMLTKRGQQELPKSISRRDIGRIFGISHDTAATMVRTISKVNLADFRSQACHPGTRWPHWKYVKGSTFRDAYKEAPKDICDQHRAERLAVRYGKDIDNYGRKVVDHAWRLVNADEMDDAYDDDQDY